MSFPKAGTVTRGRVWESGFQSNFLPLDNIKKIPCISTNHIQLELSFCKICVGQLGNSRSKSSNLQLILGVLAIDSKNCLLLRDLWEVCVLFDISVSHPVCLTSLTAFTLLFLTRVTFCLPQFSRQWCQKCYLGAYSVTDEQTEGPVILGKTHFSRAV